MDVGKDEREGEGETTAADHQEEHAIGWKQQPEKQQQQQQQRQRERDSQRQRNNGSKKNGRKK